MNGTKEEVGYGAPEVVAGGAAGLVTAGAGYGIATIQNVFTELKQSTGKGYFESIKDIKKVAIQSGEQLTGDSDKVQSFITAIYDAGDKVIENSNKMKIGQIAGIAAATLAVVGLVAYGVHKHRENNAEVQPANDKIVAGSPATQQMQRAHG